MKKIIAIMALAIMLGSFVVVGVMGVGETDDYSVVMHKVGNGERVWNIVQEYNDSSCNTNELVYLFKQENGGSDSLMLAVGETVRVPVLKERSDK
jgi:hypothetical protein